MTKFGIGMKLASLRGPLLTALLQVQNQLRRGWM